MGLLMERLKERRRVEQGIVPIVFALVVSGPIWEVTRPVRTKSTRANVIPKPVRAPSTCATCGIVVGGKQKDVRYCRPCWKLREQELHAKYYEKVVANRPPKPEVPCARCGTVFVQRTVRIRHCSDRCHEAERNETALARRRALRKVEA